MSQSYLLETRGLHFAYPGHVCGLDGVDLRVRDGSRVAFVGANGAGKTTLMLHLNGTLRPHCGEILLDGEATGYSRAELSAWRRQVGLVFQNPDDQLFAGTVYQDVSFGPLNLGLSEAEVRERVEESLAALDIAELADRPTHMLSFGQKKRASLAGAVAMRPRVLMLDEPTAGLDPEGAASLLQALEKLRQGGATILLATHDMDLAYSWADEVAVMNAGRLLAQGPPQSLLCDKDLLRAARLRPPLVLEIARALQIDPLPRTREELLAGVFPARAEQSL